MKKGTLLSVLVWAGVLVGFAVLAAGGIWLKRLEHTPLGSESGLEKRVSELEKRVEALEPEKTK